MLREVGQRAVDQQRIDQPQELPKKQSENSVYSQDSYSGVNIKTSSHLQPASSPGAASSSPQFPRELEQIHQVSENGHSEGVEVYHIT